MVQPMDKHRFTAPVSVKTYRKLGPFDAASLPAGLLREHRTKQGTWARLSVHSGEIGFVWDDPEGQRNTVILGPGDSIDVPPRVPHHLVPQRGDFSIEIEFLAKPK